MAELVYAQHSKRCGFTSMWVRLPPAAQKYTMDKQEIINQTIFYFKERAKELESSINRLQEEVINSPHAMQSWSDTTRSQTRGLISDLQPRLKSLKDCLESLKDSQLALPVKKIKTGALAKISLGGETAFYFFIPPGTAGQTIILKEQTINLISSGSPLFKALQNKKAGYKTVFLKQNLEILEIA